jgi:hypothetical protein
MEIQGMAYTMIAAYIVVVIIVCYTAITIVGMILAHF